MPASTRSLTPTRLHGYVREQCFQPRFEARVGVELELLTAPAADPAGRLALDDLLAALASVVPPEGSSLTLEPGGQVELSSRPYAGPVRAVAAMEADLDALRSGLAAAGITTAAVGLDFVRSHRRVVRSDRYEAMEAYFRASEDGAGRAMMCGTASTQVNLDLGDEAVLNRRWRLAHALGPVLVAAFANSPLATTGPTGARSSRQQIWAALDPSRSAPVVTAPGPQSPGPAEAWARYAMSAGVMLIRTVSGRCHPVGPGLSFAAWVADGHELGYPTLDDFAYHLSTLFPPVRPKGWLELRMIDALPDPWWQVAVVVTAALLDDPAAMEVAEHACAPVAHCWADAARHGLAHPALASAARTCFAAALEALPGMGAGPALLAATSDYADRYVGRRRTPGDDLLDAWFADRAGVQPTPTPRPARVTG
jgi:glutamate--cysteine ligase